MRKLFVLMIMVVWCLSVLSQSDAIKFEFKGGISQLEDSAIVFAEINITKLLTEINRANTNNYPLDISQVAMTAETKEKLLDYWKNIHFYCLYRTNEQRIVSSGENIKLEGIPIMLNPSDNTYRGALQKKLEICIDSWGEIIDIYVVSRKHELSQFEGKTYVVDGIEYYIGSNGEVYIGASNDEYDWRGFYRMGIYGNHGNLIIPNTAEIENDKIIMPVVGITGLTNCEKPIHCEQPNNVFVEDSFNPQELIKQEEYSFLVKTTAGFRDCVGIMSVTFPKYMKWITPFSFNRCANISELNFVENSIVTIDSFAFANCKKLPKVIFPNGLKIIGKGAFFRCKKLNTIRIPASVEFIGKGAFAQCHLTEILLDKGNESFILNDGILYDKNKTRIIACEKDHDTLRVPSFIKHYGDIFCNNGMKVLHLQEGMKCVEDDSFSYNDKLSRIIFPESLDTLGKRSFEYCTLLDSVYIPDNVRLVSSNCFRGCANLKMVSIPHTLHFGLGVFGGCYNLKKIEVRYPNGKKKKKKINSYKF